MNYIETMKTSIDTMSMGERLFGSLQVTLLGIGIVFVSLAVLYFSVVIMQKILKKSVEAKPSVVESIAVSEPEPEVEQLHIEENILDDTQLIAVITAAVAASLDVPAQKIAIKGIKRAQDSASTWAKVGRIEQINNML